MRAMVLAALLLAAPAHAAPIEDGQVWVNVNAQGAIKERLLYCAELQPRVFDGGGEVGQVIAPPDRVEAFGHGLGLPGLRARRQPRRL